MNEFTENETHLARLMFDAYGAHCDWKAWDGRPMPSWEAVNDAVRSHWCAAARAARDFLAGVHAS